MPSRTLPSIPSVLTIAGSDSGGGAGIQADLKTFSAHGVHGLTVITCVTAQNPSKVSGIHLCPPQMIEKQLTAIWKPFAPQAVKTGALGSAEIIQAVAQFLRKNKTRKVPLIIDPVLISGSGATLVDLAGEAALETLLLPLAALVTPNIPEAAHFAKRSIDSEKTQRSAAAFLQQKWKIPVLVKGGHGTGSNGELCDVFNDGTQELLLRSRKIRGLKTHGTGCAYSAAIAAACAMGLALSDAIEHAHVFLQGALRSSYSAGGATVLGLDSGAMLH
jgi:hydroxymethylpyrimidine/phosphomethylpyrimidine kinase